MRYIAIINTDEPLTERTIQFIKDTIFCGNEQVPYVFEIEDIKYKSESQESILDKIREEIEQIIGERNLDDYDFCSGLICAKKIIDKHTKESEG